MASGHNKMLQPPVINMGPCDSLLPLAVNRGHCELKDAMVSGHNRLWLPPVAKFHQAVSDNDYGICEQSLNNVKFSLGLSNMILETRYCQLMKLHLTIFVVEVIL